MFVTDRNSCREVPRNRENPKTWRAGTLHESYICTVCVCICRFIKDYKGPSSTDGEVKYYLYTFVAVILLLILSVFDLWVGVMISFICVFSKQSLSQNHEFPCSTILKWHVFLGLPKLFLKVMQVGTSIDSNNWDPANWKWYSNPFPRLCPNETLAECVGINPTSIRFSSHLRVVFIIPGVIPGIHVYPMRTLYSGWYIFEFTRWYQSVLNFPAKKKAPIGKLGRCDSDEGIRISGTSPRGSLITKVWWLILRGPVVGWTAHCTSFAMRISGGARWSSTG